MEVERSAARRKTLARSRSKRFNPAPKISKAVYGKESVVKLAYTFNANATAGTGIYSNVQSLVAVLQVSNDWANYAASYQNFNILKVKIQYVPCGQAGSVPNAIRALGICYTVKDNTALTNINQVADHTNYTVWGLNYAPGASKMFFKFNTRPKIRPPQSTADATENFGWVKHYSTDIGNTGANPIGLFVYTFTVAFSGEA